MSSKRQCKKCENSMRWALPVAVDEKNIDYAKTCLNAVKHSMVCGITMKTKAIDHEQYCKYYSEKESALVELEERHEKERIVKLEGLIEEYERK